MYLEASLMSETVLKFSYMRNVTIEICLYKHSAREMS